MKSLEEEVPDISISISSRRSPCELKRLTLQDANGFNNYTKVVHHASLSRTTLECREGS